MTDIDALLATMTLEEKAGQLNMLAWGAPLTGSIAAGDATEAVRAGKVGSLFNLVGAKEVERVQRVAVEETRLKIPLMFGYDVIHGQRTMFPIPLAEAGAFDPDLWERTARAAAVEAAEDGQDLTFAPMLDVSRDPRWGRTCEGAGEDAWVNARFGEAKTRGFQGHGRAGLGLEADDAVAGCAKHFCGYGAVNAGREYAAGDVSMRTVREVYLPPFEAALAAGCATIMPSLSSLNGEPLTASKTYLDQWLRVRMGFDGVVISDYGAIRELINHGVAGDEAEAAAAALKAGCDYDMMGYAYVDHLPEAVRRGLVREAELDVSVRRVLVLKQRLGLFDDPYRRCRKPRDATAQAGRRGLAREAARRSVVLLTNDKGLVPLMPARQRIAVIGPLADATREMVGPWAAAADPGAGVGVLAGLREAYPEATLDHEAGVAIKDGDTSGIAAAVAAARGAEIVVLCVGEAAYLSGEATSRTSLDLPGHQRALAEAVLGAGTPVIAIVFCGRPPIVPWLAERADALICAWFLGNEAGHALADLLSGRVAPSGRLPMTWPRSMGQVPIFFGETPSGRPRNPADHYTSKYLDSPNTPLFPFGHGLATTSFAVSDLRTDSEVLAPGRRLGVSCVVANTGARAGEATLFLFVRDPVASVTRPALELRGWAKTMLEPGTSDTMRFAIDVDDVAFTGDDHARVIEPGAIDILVGQSADPDGLLKVRVRVDGGVA